MTIRTFIAIEVDPGPRLCRVIDQLGQIGSPVRLARLPGLHLTLRFLGDTDESVAPRLTELLDQLVERHSGFRRSLTGLGVFPDRARPTVVWAGVSAPELAALQSDVDDRVCELGWQPEGRPYRPHVTLARVNPRKAVPHMLNELLDRHTETDFGEHQFDRVALYQSEPGGVYRVLHDVRLSE